MALSAWVVFPGRHCLVLMSQPHLQTLPPFLAMSHGVWLGPKKHDLGRVMSLLLMTMAGSQRSIRGSGKDTHSPIFCPFLL